MYAHNGMLSGHQKEISLFTTTWMNLEGITLSEKKKNTKWSHLYLDYKKQNKQYKMKTDSDTEKKMGGVAEERDVGGEKQLKGTNRYKPLVLK